MEKLVQEGNRLRRIGQIHEAIASYTKARDLSPGTYEIRVLLADTLRRAGEAGRALPEYEAAQRLDPTRPEGYTGRALILRSRYDYEGAVAVLQDGESRVAAGRRPDLLLVRAETRRHQGRLEEAAALFEDILKARPQEAPARAGLARVAEDRGDLDGALREWDAYVGIKPDDQAASLRRQELRELRASIEALRAMVESGRPDARVLGELGRLQAVAGDRRGAADSYRRALRIEPEQVEARRGLALALRDTGPGGAAEASREFRRLLKRAPDDGVSLYGLVALAAAGGNARDEEDAWRALLRARPDDLYALRGYVAFLERQGPESIGRAIDRETTADAGRGSAVGLRRLTLLLAAAGRFEETGETLYRLLLQDPTDPWTLEVANDVLFLDPDLLRVVTLRQKTDLEGKTGANGLSGAPDTSAAAQQALLARLSWWSGRGGEALVVLRQAVAAHPESAVLHSALGEAYQEIARRPDLAIAELRRAVERDPGRRAAHVDLALGLLRSGHPREAAAAARQDLQRREPGFAPELSVLGAALAETGDFEGAAAAYGDALRADPADNFGLARGQLPVTLAALGRNVEARRALRGTLTPIPEMLYREAWAFARDTCRDRAFNGQDWLAWRTRYRGTLRTEEEAYRAITAMLSSLGDTYTRLRDPDETVAMFLARRGDSIVTDPLGRASLQSKTVVTGELPGGLGYIRLSNFTDPKVVAEVRAALESMRQKEGIVLDLRGNSGGLSRSADEIGNLLVGPGLEAGVDASGAGDVPQITAGDGAVTDSPITVVVDGQTGSAAERLARALSLTGRATLTGDPTFGKGRAQSSRVLPGGVTILVSTSEMLDSEGRPLQGRGLVPGRKAAPEAPTPPPKPAGPS